MTSSTSHSDAAAPRRLPRKLLLALLVAILAWLVSATYTLRWNPEVALFRHAALVKLAWSQHLDQQFTNKTIVFGGSSSTFSIDAALALRERQTPIANLALGAGLGAKVLTRFALQQAHAGDTLLMMFEPGLLAADLEPTQLGQQIAIALGRPALAHPADELLPTERLPARIYGAALRPGGYHFFTLLGKVIRRQPLYRYTTTDFDEAGQQQTTARAPLSTPRGQVKLSEPARLWLRQLRDECDQQNIRLIYALPWAYCPPEQTEAFQQENEHFLAQIAAFMPVLNEPRRGAYGAAEHFADTAYHLNKQGAALRTRELLDALDKSRRAGL